MNTVLYTYTNIENNKELYYILITSLKRRSISTLQLYPSNKLILTLLHYSNPIGTIAYYSSTRNRYFWLIFGEKILFYSTNITYLSYKPSNSI